MLRDGYLTSDLRAAGEQAAQLEADGFDGAFTAETSHDPFLPIVAAAATTERMQLGTGIAVAFARNPMTTANTARDLNEFSEGRFILGLGSQIKPHITKRFSMPWSAPAARMKEFIEAMHAIWTTWDTGEPLRHKGEHYTHTLMTEFFDPGPAKHGRPDVYLAAVGPMMLKVCAEVSDGWLVHPFITPGYMEDEALPTLHAAIDAAGRQRGDVSVSLPVFVVSGDTEAEVAKRDATIRQQIGFYGSTPAYAKVLEHHGWGDAHTELNSLTKQGRWGELASVVDDEILRTFAVVAEPDDVPAEIDRRYGHLADRISVYADTPG